MKKILLLVTALTFCITTLFANEVNVFSARHYDSDIQLYEKFTVKTGIKVNVVSGKDKALQKRISEEGTDSKADLYITADAGRLGAFDAAGMFQNSMSSKIKSEGFTDKFQLYDNTITTKTTLILDISKNEKNTSSIEIFGPHAPGAYGWDPTVAATGGTGTGWGRGYAASTTIGNYFQTQSSNIRDYNITLSDSLYYPPNTEVMLESFTIHKFQGYKRDSTNTTSTPAITGETFSNFIVRIRGGKFENIKKFSNVDLYSEDATIIVPNHPYGSSTITINQPQQHHIDPTQHYVGTLKEGGIIDSLRVDLLGTFIDTEKVVENGFSTWTYLYPWDVDSQCTIRLKLIPPI